MSWPIELGPLFTISAVVDDTVATSTASNNRRMPCSIGIDDCVVSVMLITPTSARVNQIAVRAVTYDEPLSIAVRAVTLNHSQLLSGQSR